MAQDTWHGRETVPQQEWHVEHQESGLTCALGRSRALRLVPIILAAALLFTRLSCPLLEPEETRYAEIPRQMLAEGRFFTPVWHGEPYWHKPPLLYWLVMVSYELFGVHDWAARLVPCLAAFATVLVVYGWAWRAAGPAAGFCSALVLALSARFVYQGRMIGMDGLLALCVTTGLAAGHVALTGAGLRKRWWMLSAFACALGFLTKGPVALALIGVPLWAWSRFAKDAVRPGLPHWSIYVGIAAGVAAPWYLALAWTDPEAAGAFFWLHNVQRFVVPFDHAEPLWYFLPILLLGTLPWSLLAVPLCFMMLRRALAPSLGFFLLSFAWCFVFFSLAGCKRAGYVLPMLPLWSMVLGTFLSRPLRAEAVPRCLRPWAAPATLTVVTLVAAAGIAVAAGIAGVCSMPLAFAVGGGVSLAAMVAASALRHAAAPRAWSSCATAVFLLLLLGVLELLPAYHRRFGLRGQVRRHGADGEVPVACYPRRWDSIGFYLGRADVRVYAADKRAQLMAELACHERTLVFVKNRGYLNGFLEDLPATLEFVPDARQGSNVTSGFVREKDTSPPRKQGHPLLALRAPSR